MDVPKLFGSVGLILFFLKRVATILDPCSECPPCEGLNLTFQCVAISRSNTGWHGVTIDSFFLKKKKDKRTIYHLNEIAKCKVSSELFTCLIIVSADTTEAL